MNLAKLLEGPAIVSHRGVLFATRGGSTLTPQLSGFPIESDIEGVLANRADDVSLQLALTPVGVYTAEVIDVLWRWRNPTIGQLVTPVYDIESIALDTHILTLLGSAGPRKGCPVMAASFGALPAAINDATVYFVGVPAAETPNVITLHATAADAANGANPVAIADAGTGDHRIIEQEPLVIHTTMNRKITFWNAALVGMPAVEFSTTKTLIGAVTFEAFRKNNAAWSAANSLYTVEKALLNVTPPDKTKIPTQEYAYAWGDAPWASWKTRGSFVMTPSLQLGVVSSDGDGTLCRKINSVGVSGRGSPDGFSEQQLLDVLGIQGGTAGRGKARSKVANLNISGTGVFARIPNASAQQTPLTFSPTDPRAGEIDFVSERAVGEAAFQLSTAAIA